MTESIPKPVLDRVDQQTRELILHVRKRRWRYFLIVGALGIYFFYFFKYHVLEYSSTAYFFVNNHNIITSSTIDLKGFDNETPEDGFSRIYELINSESTQKHLIEKFHLLNHYNIDSTGEFYLQKAVATVRGHIDVKKSQFNTITVTVRDRYRYLPSEMANEIVDYIEKLNEEHYMNNIKRKLEISKAYMTQLEHENFQKSIGIDSMIKKINAMLVSGKLSDKYYFEYQGQQQRLGSLISSFESAMNEIINAQKLYNISLQAMNFRIFPTITVLQMAMPAYRSIAFSAMLYSILAMFLVFLLLILQGYLYLNYKNYLKLIFKGE